MKKTTIAFLVLLLAGISNAQITTLHNFAYKDGEPSGSLLLSGNTLYGMTYRGGIYTQGTIFSMNTNGTNYKTLHSFSQTNPGDGAYPYGSLIMVSGILYGLTSSGGLHSDGNVFSIHTDGTGFKDLYDFANGDGNSPDGTLTYSAGKLFGYTYKGGVSSYGNIFTVDTGGHNFKNLYYFSNVGSGGYYPDYGALAISANGKVLYGTASSGGTDGLGTLYAIDTDGTNFHTLLYFNDTNGGYPYGSVILSGTKLFGMTESGGLGYGDGTLYSVDTSGKNIKTLLAFNYVNGEYPYGEVKLSGTNLFGMTYEGGQYGDGTIFSIDTDGTAYNKLFDFDVTNGQYPYGDLTLSNDTLFGMTYEGGTYDDGVVFRYIDANLTAGVNAPITVKNGVSVYPNPCNGRFNISLSHPELVSEFETIEVYNVLGEKVYSQLSTFNSQLSIDLSSRPSGIYLYRAVSQNGELIGEGKIVIER